MPASTKSVAVGVGVGKGVTVGKGVGVSVGSDVGDAVGVIKGIQVGSDVDVQVAIGSTAAAGDAQDATTSKINKLNQNSVCFKILIPRNIIEPCRLGTFAYAYRSGSRWFGIF